jgi:hypothetical protein
MALKNPKLTKLGSTSINSTGASNSGHAQSCIVVPAVALPFPVRIAGEDPTWHSRLQQYVESVTPTIKYSQDWE